jgi:hypothetical protein
MSLLAVFLVIGTHTSDFDLQASCLAIGYPRLPEAWTVLSINSFQFFAEQIASQTLTFGKHSYSAFSQ